MQDYAPNVVTIVPEIRIDIPVTKLKEILSGVIALTNMSVCMVAHNS